MAVLIEAISVVIRRAAIDDRYPGGWPAFCESVPNNSLCADDDLLRVGFMTPPDVRAFIEHLIDRGLRYLEEGTAIDLVLVDQLHGFAAPCEWAHLCRLRSGIEREFAVSACQAAGRDFDSLATPGGWQYEGSISQSFVFVPHGHFDRVMRRVRCEDDGTEVYNSALTGAQEWFMARARGGSATG